MTTTKSEYIASLDKIKTGLIAARDYYMSNTKNIKRTNEINQQHIQDINQKTDRIIDVTGLIFSGLFIGGIILVAIRRQLK